MNSSPWAKLTTSMIPKISVRPDATSARIIPVTMPLMVWINSWSKGMDCQNSTLDTHVLMDDRIIGAQLGGHGVVADGALLQEIDAPGGSQGQRHVLLDQQHRHILLPQHIDYL